MSAIACRRTLGNAAATTAAAAGAAVVGVVAVGVAGDAGDATVEGIAVVIVDVDAAFAVDVDGVA